MLIKICSRILGVLLMIFSLTLLPPIFVSYLYTDSAMPAFFLAFVVTFLTGLILWFPFHQYRQSLRTRDGFMIVVLFWSVFCLFGAIPFYLIESPDIRFIDAIFESVSGITTTGATALANIDALPKSVLYYRQQLQFLGGLGIIVLAVAILPMLGVGGLQLFRAEMTGPLKDDKLTPRIAQTAKTLWAIYVGLTLACIAAYWLAGMNLFDAVGYAFSTVSTGGYAPHSESLDFYPALHIKLIATFFMIMGSISFALHFSALHHRNLLFYFTNTEVRCFIISIALMTVVVFFMLWHYDLHSQPLDDIIVAFYQITSIASTTGFTTDALNTWPSFVPILIFLAGMIGGCAGSTTGGIKTLRIVLLYKQGLREIKRLVHPNGEFPLKLHQQTVPDKVIDAVWGFIGIYLLLFAFIVLALMGTGLDLYTAFSSTVGSLANVGPGLNATFESYALVPDSAKWILSFAMLVGRLEVFTVIVLFSAVYWRK